MSLRHITKDYHTNSEVVSVLNDTNFSIYKGQMVVIMGASGSGKSTLMNIIGLLDRPTSGDIYYDNETIHNLGDESRTSLRSSSIGFVFQDYHLLPHLSAEENVSYPLYLHKEIKSQERIQKSQEMLKQLGMYERRHHYPKQLSGGEQQRVAIARSLVHNPDLILADEPTGNLDKQNEESIIELLQAITREDKAVVVVTHNEIFQHYADVFYQMVEGQLQEVSSRA
ncbi:ABC transporter ATP-binding protein [Pontibacillus halophilus]|nr:ABC transporter ATP-binding protein [Pontibacillus halophilus]